MSIDWLRFCIPYPPRGPVAFWTSCDSTGLRAPQHFPEAAYTAAQYARPGRLSLGFASHPPRAPHAVKDTPQDLHDISALRKLEHSIMAGFYRSVTAIYLRIGMDDAVTRTAAMRSAWSEMAWCIALGLEYSHADPASSHIGVVNVPRRLTALRSAIDRVRSSLAAATPQAASPRSILWLQCHTRLLDGL
ncbi:unnamed protein product [Peniophora sp. CBMAI 1063]|nr:unnamed protein product [Peniophora sp. CBMAI 1063]